ncbi:MAG: heme exporter protein CcmD [Azospirillum brasilense]|nr:MAG: heme exporter protein CcmD [Azospirillum brasilense]
MLHNCNCCADAATFLLLTAPTMHYSAAMEHSSYILLSYLLTALLLAGLSLATWLHHRRVSSQLRKQQSTAFRERA